MDFNLLHSTQSHNRLTTEQRFDLASVQTLSSFHRLQYELRKYGLILRTRYDDSELERIPHEIANNSVEAAIGRFIGLCTGEDVDVEYTPYARRGAYVYHEAEHYPAQADGDGVIRNEANGIIRNTSWITPQDGDLLLRKAIVVDSRFGDVLWNIYHVATVLDGQKKGRPFRDFAREEVQPIHNTFQRSVGDLYPVHRGFLMGADKLLAIGH